MRHEAEDEMDKVKGQRSEFEKEKTQHQERLQRAMETEAKELANDLAKESGLTATLILQVGTDTADGKTTYNLERMKNIAKSVPKGEEEEEEETPTVKGQRTLADGAGGRSGKKGMSTMQDYDEAYNEGRISIEEYAKARQRFEVAF